VSAGASPADRFGAPRVRADQRALRAASGAHVVVPPSRTFKAVFVANFWLGLAVALGVWWLNTPSGSVQSTADALIEVGRVTGLVSGYALLVQVLLMSRLGLLERNVSANDIIRWHREMGATVIITVLAHVAFLLAGYAAQDNAPIVSETLLVLRTYQDIVSAFVATGILAGIGLLAVRAVRAIVSYEVWHFLHLATYAVLLLSYGHQFALGRDLAGPGRAFWIALYVAVLLALFWGRVVDPLRLNLRHRLRVANVVAEGHDTFSIYIRGHRLDELGAQAGQFFRWRFLTRNGWWQSHPFSLSAAPHHAWLRLTIKAVGGHTERLRHLQPGARVLAEGPSGGFTAERQRRPRALLIAAGSGIAPIRALLEELPPGATVIYRASVPGDLIFTDELDWLARTRDTRVHYVVGSRDAPGPQWALSPAGLAALVPDVARRDVYLCGPEGLVSAATDVLRTLRVPRRHIHRDPFEF
jgi:predicted ferric reductase